MNPATVTLTRCLKHPSQFSAGFCSSCLVERLSNVHPRNQKNDGDISIFVTPSDLDQKSQKTRDRRTLLDLFHLEDEVSLDLEREARASKIKEDAISLSLESSSAFRHSPASSENSKKSGSSSRFSSSFPLKLFWRRTKKIGKESSSTELTHRNGLQEQELSTEKKSFRLSLEDPSTSYPQRNSRRSLDGLGINKAFSCSFSCGKEMQLEERNLDASTSRRRSATYLSEEINIDAKSDKVHEEEKAKRRSKMWRWSFTSPFGEMGHSRQPSLDRSLSEPSHQRRRTKTAEVPKPGTLPHFPGPSMHPSKKRDRERNLSKSRSAHFSSPRNVSSGLLRFYLTPLRSNRRSINRSRSRTSYSFGPGLFGIH